MILQVVQHALMITGFVFVMMLVIEYLNVLTAGGADRLLSKWKYGQSIFASFLGATPGCLGAYAVGSLYMHRIVTVGALTASMVATCGDEAFLMLSLFPEKALILFLVLFFVGAVTGMVTDLILKGRKTKPIDRLESYEAAHHEDRCVPFSKVEFVSQWRKCSPHRGVLALALALFSFGIITGSIGHHHLAAEDVNVQQEHVHEGHAHEQECDHAEGEHGWDWARVTLLLAGLFGLFVVVTVPDHFLEAHFWHHLVVVHLWRIFLWILGAMLLVELLMSFVDVRGLVTEHALPALLVACLIGLIPQSGPHLVFVTLYAEGSIPFGILLASCIVQDGHGLVPILSHSRMAFFGVKLLKFVLGLVIGFIALSFG